MHLAPEVPVHATPTQSDSPPTFQKFVKSGNGIPPATASLPEHAPGVCRLGRSEEGTMRETQLIVSISTYCVGVGDRVR